ncbi:MAG: selenoneine biosynthesis selenosugar synthase SenB [Burkholderiales bacterium]
MTPDRNKIKPHIYIVTPASEKANNGNWFTASRWERFLRKHYRVTLALTWDGTPCDAMIALHARRSAASIAAFAGAHPALPLVVVLTGTDLYRDIHTDADSRRSLELASHLVVLQPEGVQELDPYLRARTTVIYQSAPSLKPVEMSVKRRMRRFDVVMIGHLRHEKDPLTFMRAAQHVTAGRIRLLHIGGALEPVFALHAGSTQNLYPHYRWLGHLPRTLTRQRLKRSQLMVIASAMEGGANVIIEAITSGVPVLASDIPGNRGMLGDDYAGYFPRGDSLALARLIESAAADNAYYDRLQAQCAARAPLFMPEREQAAVLNLMNDLTDACNRCDAGYSLARNDE